MRLKIKLMNPELTVYIDVDETLVRNYGTKRMPMPSMVKHVKALFEEGVELYCWSSGGPDYCKAVADELGIANCFVAFLRKPQAMVDDMEIANWRYLKQVHPNAAVEMSKKDYLNELFGG